MIIKLTNLCKCDTILLSKIGGIFLHYKIESEEKLMGKDNSSSKSELRLQLDKTNELLRKTEEKIRDAYYKVELQKKILGWWFEEGVFFIADQQDTHEIDCRQEIFLYKQDFPDEWSKQERMKSNINDALEHISQYIGEQLILEKFEEKEDGEYSGFDCVVNIK